jgi:hypothetical protein
MTVVVIRRIGRKRASKGVGRMGLAAGVQVPIHHGDRHLNHEHGYQHHSQSCHALPQSIVQMLKQGFLEAVLR